MEPSSLFSLGKLTDIRPEAALLPRVLARVHLLRVRRLRRQLQGSLGGVSLLLLVILWNWRFFGGELGGASPFWGFVRILRTDPDVVLGSMKEFMVGLLESLPIESLLVACGFLLCILCLLFVWRALREQKQISPSSFSS